MKTITLTDEQYQALCNGESVTIEPPKPKVEKWQPKGGQWYVQQDGEIRNQKSTNYPRQFGMSYPTIKHAEKARDAMRVHNRLLAWLSENDDGWVSDWEDTYTLKSYVFYNSKKREWQASHLQYVPVIGAVYMSKENAEKLCKLLNEGVVEL
jgi:hypothetical protein